MLAVRFPELAQRVDEMDMAGKLTDRLSIDVVGASLERPEKLAWAAYGRIGWDAGEDRNIFGMSAQRDTKTRIMPERWVPSRTLPKSC